MGPEEGRRDLLWGGVGGLMILVLVVVAALFTANLRLA